MINAAVDASGVMAVITKLQRELPGIQSKAVQNAAYEVMRLSQIDVPHDKGSLQNSGTVEQVGEDFVVGYHEPYAARLHEHPEYHFQKGRKGKYLEDPIRRNERVLGLKVVESFDNGIGGVTN